VATTSRRTAAKLHLLTTKQVQHASGGDHSDGGGLLLRVRGESCSWVLRYTSPTGRRREMGLGVCRRGSPAQAGDSVTGARDIAHKCRELLRQGLDPIDQRDQQRETGREAETVKKAEKARERWTLARCARDYHERVIEPTRTDKHAAQWISSLENHVPAPLWHRPITEIDPPALMQALADIKPHERARNLSQGDRVAETMSRIHQRLDAVFEDAIFHKRCTSNPAAAVKRKMRETLPKKKAGQFAALPYREAPAFMARLRDAPRTAARCLEFAVLTAARTGEALGAVWSEFDLEAKSWLVPAERMKASGKDQPEPHLVHLSARALEVLKAQAGVHADFVFPSVSKADSPQSNMAMLAVLGRLGERERTTVHGLCRATFSTWAYETAAARPDVIEACLAHREADKVKAAYNRAQFTDERRALLAAWADYLAQPPAVVLPFEARAA
jgi:integrase